MLRLRVVSCYWRLTSNMWKTILTVLRLLKRLLRCQVFAALTTSSVQGLRILISCFRTFLTKIRGPFGHSSDSQISNGEALVKTVSHCTSQCPKATPLLPFYAASSTPAAASPSTPPSRCNIPTPRITQQPILPTPCIPSDVSRYVNRPLVYVFRHESKWIVLRSCLPESRLAHKIHFRDSRGTSQTSECISQVSREFH